MDFASAQLWYTSTPKKLLHRWQISSICFQAAYHEKYRYISQILYESEPELKARNNYLLWTTFSNSLPSSPACQLSSAQAAILLLLIARLFVSCALVFSHFSPHPSCSSCFQESYMALSPRLFALCTLLSFLLAVQTPTEILLLGSAGVKHPQH